MKKRCFKSIAGFIEITEKNNFITKVEFLKNCSFKSDKSAVLIDVEKQILEFFERKRQNFDIKIRFEGTDFQQKVWRELLKIPYGSTISYKELAKRIGNPKAYRAVANANRLNPLPIIVPCHRVIGSNGKLTGYASGLEIKRLLLQIEGAITLDKA